MEDFNFSIVARKSVQGIFALVSRTFVIQLLGFIATLILTIVLEPAIFGIYFVASSLMVFLNAFGDIGLAASIIQKKEIPTIKEIQTVFTVQQVLVIAIVLPLTFFSGQIASFYQLNQEGQFLLLALLFSFFTSSLRSVPTALMERRLDFKRYVIPQIGESLVYYLTLIIFALSGLGITSFTIAVIGRSIVGLILTYIVQPWNVGIAFDIAALKRLISFGLPFQANSVLALIKDDVLTIYLAKIIPFSQMGYIGFAQRWAFYPLRLIMDNVIKITFPSYSRLQHDKKALQTAIEKSLFIISFFIFPTAVGFILLSPYFLSFIPRYAKWEPALISLSLFALQTVISSISTPLTNFLNAIGKVKITLYFMIFWTVAIWITTLLFINILGFNGVATASLVVSLTSFGVFIVVRRYVAFSLIGPVLRQVFAAVCMGIFMLFTKEFVSTLPLLFVEIVFAGLFYLGIVYFLAQSEIKSTGRFIIQNIGKK